MGDTDPTLPRYGTDVVQVTTLATMVAHVDVSGGLLGHNGGALRRLQVDCFGHRAAHLDVSSGLPWPPGGALGQRQYRNAVASGPSHLSIIIEVRQLVALSMEHILDRSGNAAFVP